MNFRSFSFGVAVATALTAGSLMTSAPAQAFNLQNKTLNFGGSAQLVNATSSPSTLNFITSRIGLGTSSEFGVLDQSVSPTDLTLAFNGSSTWTLAAPFPNWIGGLSNGATFDLQTFVLTQIGTNPDDFRASFSGIFNPGAVPSSGGILTTQGTFTSIGSTYSASVTSIPTPALLPGLAGLGLAAMRKRKQTAAEPVKA